MSKSWKMKQHKNAFYEILPFQNKRRLGLYFCSKNMNMIICSRVKLVFKQDTIAKHNKNAAKVD